MLDVIKEVIAAEAEAGRVLSDARIKGDGILADARKRARELLDQSLAQAKLEAASLSAAAIEEAGREKAALLERVRAEIESRVRLDDAARRGAVEAVVRCVRGERLKAKG